NRQYRCNSGYTYGYQNSYRPDAASAYGYRYYGGHQALHHDLKHEHQGLHQDLNAQHRAAHRELRHQAAHGVDPRTLEAEHDALHHDLSHQHQDGHADIRADHQEGHYDLAR